MKNLFICLVLICCFSFSSHAQQAFAPVGAKWHYDQTSFMSSGIYYTWFESEKDTIVANQPCRKIIGSSGCSLFYQFLFDRNDSVFYYNNQREQFDLLYNFAAEVGDSWTIYIDNITLNLTVDSISTISVDDTILKVLYTSQSEYNGYSFSGKHIQRIGGEYLFPTMGFCDPVVGGLRCYIDSSIFYKSDIYPYDCDYVSSIDQLEANHIHVYPNPTSDFLNVETATSQTLNAEVFDLNGRKVLATTILGKSIIDISHLSPSIYLLKLTDDSGNKSTKIWVKE